ncbi:MFS transporter [Nocardia aurantia]|uniref:Putative multidrug resistance protein MdtD n=1 Tax=Nocardia aurantia TaxID=2585199 RepID=A0A7K0DY76_9NOCA|nr:MFS transporter [Nocardia aurantia]MQY29814.1 putative multidrug resistance protein MdtD [Nocardia aurantia]
MAVEDTTARHAWGALAACLLAVFVQMLDLTIVNTALPELTRDLSATGTVQLLVVTVYGLAFACTLLTAARLGERFGRRRLFLLGMTMFTVASLGCGLAGTPLELVAGRTAQGMGAAAMAAQTIAIMTAAFALRQRPLVFGIYGAVAGLAGLAGPLLGGAIVAANPFEWGWRAIFLLNLPIGAAALVVAARYLRADSDRETAACSRRISDDRPGLPGNSSAQRKHPDLLPKRSFQRAAGVRRRTRLGGNLARDQFPDSSHFEEADGVDRDEHAAGIVRTLSHCLVRTVEADGTNRTEPERAATVTDEAGHDRGRGGIPIDRLGVALSTAGLLAVLFPLTTGQQAGWPPVTVAVLIAGVVVLCGFAWQQRWVARRGGAPLVTAEVFGDRGFGIGSVLLLMFYGLFAALLLTVSVTAQSGLGFSAWQTGRLMLPFALGALAAALTSPILVARCGSRALTIGITLFAAATAQLALTIRPSAGGIGTHASSWPILLAGVGMGWFAAPLPAVMVARLGERSTGVASGLAPTVQQLGSAIGAAALGSVFFGGVAAGSGVPHAETVLAQHLAAADAPPDARADTVGRFGECARAAFAAPEHTLAARGCAAGDAAVSATATAQTYLSACVTVLWIIAAVAVLLTALTWALPRHPGIPQ